MVESNTSPSGWRAVPPETIHRKPPTRSDFLSQTKDEIVYRWARRGWSERSIAARFGVSRESIEQVLRERLAKPLDRGPVVIYPVRRAA